MADDSLESLRDLLNATVAETMQEDSLEAERFNHQEALCRIDKLNDFISSLQESVDDLNFKLATKTEEYESVILGLKRQLFEKENAPTTTRNTSPVAEPTVNQASIDKLHIQIARLEEENRSLSSRALAATDAFDEVERLSHLCNAQQSEIDQLSAKSDAYEFLKSEHTRLSEDALRSERLIERMSRDLALAREEKRPRTADACEADLWQFKRDTEQQVKRLLGEIQNLFGWHVSVTDKDEWVISRGIMKIKISKGAVVSAALPPGYPSQPALPLPELLALLVLEK